MNTYLKALRRLSDDWKPKDIDIEDKVEEMTPLLKHLTQLTSIPDQDDFDLLETLHMSISVLLEGLDQGLDTALAPLADCFRCIRNSCRTNPDTQRSYDSFQYFKCHTYCLLHNENLCNLESEAQRTVYRCMVQALANSTVNNDMNQRIVLCPKWQPNLMDIFRIDDRKCSEYVCMLLSTCFTCRATIEGLINYTDKASYTEESSESDPDPDWDVVYNRRAADFFVAAVNKLVASFKESETEWAVFAIRKLWGVAGFADVLVFKLGEEEQRFVYETLIHYIQRQNPGGEDADGETSIDAKSMTGIRSNIKDLVEKFNAEAKQVFSTTPSEVEQRPTSSSAAFSALLDVLCAASASSSFLRKIQASSELLMTVTTILIQITAASSQTDATASNSDSTDARANFHRDIVRLLGNLCWQHKKNQDTVRKLNGIIPVLNSFNINESSPFVRQWAVFALRNLCENNVKNQEVVAGIQLKGVQDLGGVLEEMGLEIELDGGKPRLKKRE